MVKKSQPGREKQIAAALMLSYPQLFVWALIFAFIGGITVWSSSAFTNNSAAGNLSLRMVEDSNQDGQPNWGDTITFDVSTSLSEKSFLSVACYQNGTNVYSVQKQYDSSNMSSANRYMHLSSAKWASGPADCNASLYDASGKSLKTLNSYNFHVNP